MKKKLAFNLASVIALSIMPTLPTHATSEYASAADLIEDAIVITLADITSSTLETAISDTTTKITVENDVVFYDGSTIGYWYADDSDTIYADAGKTETVISPVTDNTWEIDPDILEIVLSDINNDLAETITPDLSDWSKIIGKYDVTLGNITIPADQWINIELSDSPLVTGDVFNISRHLNIVGTEFQDKDNIILIGYGIDSDGKLYIQNSVHTLFCNGFGYDYDTYSLSNRISENGKFHHFGTFEDLTAYADDFPYVKIGVQYAYDTADTVLPSNPHYIIYATNADNSAAFGNLPDGGGRDLCNHDHSMKLVSDPSITYNGDIADMTLGVAFCRGEDISDSNYYANASVVSSFFASQSASSTIIGNATLRRNLSKLSSLGNDDMVVVSENGWLINGTTPINEYTGEQKLMTAGQTAEMNGIVEIEDLNFCVIVPTTLPMQADRSGTVTTATNAKIINESNAPIKITDLTINANSASGWTRVDGTPDKTRGANEFSFDVSLNIGDTLDAKTNLPFEYEADMSPAEDDVTSIDLVTIMIAFDWAE